MYAHCQLLAFPQVCTFKLLYTTLNLKACQINHRKVRDVSKGDEGSPEERPYDVSRGRNRYVTLP